MQAVSELDHRSPRHQSDVQDLTHAVGWNFTDAQITAFVASANRFFGHRVEGKLVSSAGIYIYGKTLAAIGLVMVHPDYQRRGLGRQVMTHCVEEIRKLSIPACLIATEQGEPMYRSLGFQTAEHIHRLTTVCGNGSRFSPKPEVAGAVQRITSADVTQLVAFDAVTIGDRRDSVYEHLWPQVDCGLMMRDDAGRLNGFGFAQIRNDVLMIGPLMAETPAIATHLLRIMTDEFRGTVRIDVPGGQLEFMEELLRRGFQRRRVSPQMMLPVGALPGKRCHYYGIADPAPG